jgi:GTP cyclohydrolase I
MWHELYHGYSREGKPTITVFDNNNDGIKYDEMIYDSGDYYSTCEHHMVPFFGHYHFAYIPDKKIIGLSKIARIVDYYSAKLQIQERLVKEICDEIQSACQPLGLGMVMTGRHLCKEMRGAKKIGEMKTSDLRGVFREDEVRKEFLSLCQL